MPSYDATATPPAPVATVTVSNPATGATLENIQFLLDTGADISAVPIRVAERLGVQVDARPQVQLTGFDGKTSSYPVAELTLTFLGNAIRGEYVLLHVARGLLGRDILNLGVCHLDGPCLFWSLE